MRISKTRWEVLGSGDWEDSQKENVENMGVGDSVERYQASDHRA